MKAYSKVIVDSVKNKDYEKQMQITNGIIIYC